MKRGGWSTVCSIFCVFSVVLLASVSASAAVFNICNGGCSNGADTVVLGRYYFKVGSAWAYGGIRSLVNGSLSWSLGITSSDTVVVETLGGSDTIEIVNATDGVYAISATAELRPFSSFLSSYIDGGSGTDTIFGSDHADEIYGGDGRDFIFGRGGADSIYGEEPTCSGCGCISVYSDYCEGNSGADDEVYCYEVYGGADYDVCGYVLGSCEQDNC